MVLECAKVINKIPSTAAAGQHSATGATGIRSPFFTPHSRHLRPPDRDGRSQEHTFELVLTTSTPPTDTTLPKSVIGPSQAAACICTGDPLVGASNRDCSRVCSATCHCVPPKLSIHAGSREGHIQRWICSWLSPHNLRSPRRTI